jgi:hypothetical protein
MKLRNSTTWPDHFLRRMTAWCCDQLDMPRSYVLAAQFANSRSKWGGLAYLRQRRMGVRVSAKESDFPETARQPGSDATELLADRLECLIKVTAHELAHHDQYRLEHAERVSNRTRRGGWGGSEGRTQALAFQVLRAFRANREALLAEWSVPPAERQAKPKASIQEKRAAKAQADLDRWQRKAKLAATKIRKLKARVRYYDRVAACRQGDQ